MGELAEAVQEASSESVELAYARIRATLGSAQPQKKRRFTTSVWRWSSIRRGEAGLFVLFAKVPGC